MVRQMKSGGKYYYQFVKGGKRFNGVCEGCSTRRDAEAFEKKIKGLQVDFAKAKNVDTLFERRRQEITGNAGIMLADAYDLSLKKPRSRAMSEKQRCSKRSIFADFVAFMTERHSDVKDLAAVTAIHAEEYIALIRSTGKFVKLSSYTRDGKTIERPAIKETITDEDGNRIGKAVSVIPSSRTANLYQTVCAEVFKLLAKDAGISENPFSMPKLKKTEETREAFTMPELKLIFENLDDFTRPLFTVAITTALREGDICTLKWSDLNFQDHVIRKIMNKTGRLVEIPMAETLFRYLLDQKAAAGDSEYVFPQHAKMYLENQTGVSYRVKQFLEGIGIQTTRIPKGRTRAVSVKDLHSCRHTFCYFAGMRGIPLAVVQSIVGHMTPEMTKHYSDHATTEDKRRYMLDMSDFIPNEVKAISETIVSDDPERAELRRLADVLPIEEVRAILDSIKNTKEEA